MKRTLLLICTLLCANVLWAQPTVGDILIREGVKYRIISENEAEVYGPVDDRSSIDILSIVTWHYEVPGQGIWDEEYSVTSIGGGAFSFCLNLTSVDIPNSVTSIGISAFQNCISLTSVTIPNSVTSIGDYAFNSCRSLTSLTIPNSVTSIGDYAFNYCDSLTSVAIPNSVTSIGEWAFEECHSLTSITIPNSVTSIGEGTFARCSSLTSVTIPNSVTSMGNYAFSGCSSLTSITIPNSVTSIGEEVFYNCSGLTSITLPESITSIGSGAFNGCSFLQNVTCLATTPPTIADNTVFPYPNIATLTVPCGTLEAYSAPTSFWNMFFMGRISEDGYEVVANVNNDAFGSVAIENNCSTATLTATANEGYVFLSWNDGNTENPRVVSLTSDTSFVANFALIDESSLLEAEAESISFFPNPTKSEITFSQAIEKVEVIDLTGKTFLTFTNAKTINIESLPSGAYYLRLTNEEKTTMQKVIKQ